MKLLLKYGADPTSRTAKVPERYEEGGPESQRSRSVGAAADSVGRTRRWLPIHAASGVGYGLGFAGNTHRHVPDGWLPAVKFLVEELGADVNARDHNGYTPLHHAASRGDNELIRYLVSKGADVKAVSRSGQTTVDWRTARCSACSRSPRPLRCSRASARRTITSACPADSVGPQGRRRTAAAAHSR